MIGPGVLLLGALAVVCWPGPGPALQRVVVVRSRRRFAGDRRRSAAADPFEVAAGYELFAVCLRSGLPVPEAATVTAAHCPSSLAQPLLRAAELLTLGAEPRRAWTAAENGDPGFAELAGLARRAAGAGSALSDAVDELARTAREQGQNAALAQAEKAGVKISGPLGLCFLPAFVALGIVPVVIGLAGGMLSQL